MIPFFLPWRKEDFSRSVKARPYHLKTIFPPEGKKGPPFSSQLYIVTHPQPPLWNSMVTSWRPFYTIPTLSWLFRSLPLLLETKKLVRGTLAHQHPGLVVPLQQHAAAAPAAPGEQGLREIVIALASLALTGSSTMTSLACGRNLNDGG